MKQSADIIVQGKYLVTCNKQREIIIDGAVAVQGNSIIGVGEKRAISQMFTAQQVIDVGSDTIFPGFINGHTHAAMSLFRGIADHSSLHDWLSLTIFPLEKKFLSDEFVYWGTILALMEMVRSGTTTIVDMYWYADAVAQACADMGVRAIVGSNVLHHEHELMAAEEFITTWRAHPLVTPAYAPHSPAEVPVALLGPVDI